MENKHKSRLYLGFCKQYTRQYNKQRDKVIKLPKIDLPKNFKGIYIHEMEVHNSIWNGMNLVCLINSFNKDCFGRQILGGMYSKFIINKEGKYELSIRGISILKKKRNKLQTHGN